jgi:hypothetical protein
VSVKVQFFSDLHVDVAKIKPIVVRDDVDVVAVAGDTCQGIDNAFATLRRIVPERIPIVMVAGNHEFYRRSLPDEIMAGKTAAAKYRVTFLSDDSEVVAGIRFLGATLWTDYELFGAAKKAIAMNTARTGLNDHRMITWRKKPWSRFRPEEALLLHERSKHFLRERLAEVSVHPTVVLTHHAPHRGSVEARFDNDLLTAAFASADVINTLVGRSNDLSVDSSKDSSAGTKDPSANDAKDSRPDITIWNHGHIHSSSDYFVKSDYFVNGFRILANPHGYADENPGFNPSLVVEI